MLSYNSGRALFVVVSALAVWSARAEQQATGTQSELIANLQQTLAAQQRQLEALQRTIGEQQRLLDSVLATTKAPVAPVAPESATAKPVSGNPCEAVPDSNAVPTYLRIGKTCIAPVGFMDLTAVWRDKNAGSGLGSSFGSVPYNTGVAGNLSEFRLSAQNSRLGFRVDGEWKGTHFTGFNEFDFLGTSAANGIGVTNGSFVPRLRLFWIDVRKGKWEMLGGQDWSLMTPDRKGIAMIPNDIFYSQGVDVNYVAGLTWARQAGVRLIYHANKTLSAALSVEDPNQYAGGQAGGPKITPPTALAGYLGTQIDDTSTSFLSTPNAAPDLIAKVAWDPNAKVHVEVGGIERTFKTYNLVTNQHFTKSGGGVSVNANVEVLKGIRLITNNYWSDGGGRYLFGQVPDVILRADGSPSPIRAGGTVDGVEWTHKNTILYAYYGGIYAGRNTALDANGKTLVGYGFSGSSNTQNRVISELSSGFNQTIWKDPRYGALNVMGQYEWLQRNPWSVAPGTPKAAHDSTVYVNLRYTLPGLIPNF